LASAGAGTDQDVLSRRTAQVIAHGLSSEAAIVFFDALLTIDVLMPPLAMPAIEEMRPAAPVATLPRAPM
jgi:hypothetical protein